MTWHGKGAGSYRQKMLWSRVRYASELKHIAENFAWFCSFEGDKLWITDFICAHSIDFRVIVFHPIHYSLFALFAPVF